MTGNVARITLLMFVVTRLMELRRANDRLRYLRFTNQFTPMDPFSIHINTLNAELNPICYLVALLGVHHFLHVSRIRVKLLTFRLLMSYIYGAAILDVSRSHTTTQHSR